MPSSKEKRAQRHQSQSKQNVDKFSGRGKTTENIPGVGYREVQLIGNKKYYTSLSDDPNQSLGGSARDTSITVTGGSSANHGALSGLLLDSHTQYVLADGTRAFGGNWTNAGITVADLGTITTVDINGGTIDGVTIATSNVTVGTGKTLDVSGGTLTLSNDQISGDKINGGTIGSVTISQLSGALDANSQAITNINIDSGNIDGVTIATSDITVGAGKTLNVSAGTLTLADNQISGDKVEGGTINAITITGLTTAGITATSNIDIGSFDFRANTLIADDLTSGRVVFSTTNGQLIDNSNLTFATDTLTATKIGAYTLTGKLTAGSIEIEGSAFDIDGGDISAITISGGLTWSYAQDLNSQQLTNVNIDSGTVDGATIGVNSHTTIKGTTIDATTDFTIGGTVITDAQIEDDGHLAINGVTGVTIKENGTEVIKVDTEKKILFNSYSQTSIYNLYGLNNQATKYHLTSGQADFQENFSVISMFEEDTTYIAYPT